MKRISLSLVFVILISALFASCGNNAEISAASGTWKGVYTKFVGDETKNTNEQFSLELKADGTGTHARNDAEYQIEWSLEGESFKMTETFLGLKIEYTGTLKGNELIIFNGDPDNDLTYQYVYEKA